MALSSVVVLDFETTGFYFRGNDRIVEVAMIRLDDHAAEIERFETLVNPRRDMGPMHIHGISTADILEAPTFEEIAGDVHGFLDQSIVVGHNVTFDLRFLAAEFGRLGYFHSEWPYVCTLGLSRRFAPEATSRRLDNLCESLGFANPRAHSAMNDALAVVNLLRHFELTQLIHLREHARYFVGEDGDFRRRGPRLEKTGRTHTRSQATGSVQFEKCFLRELVERLKHGDLGENIATEEYMLLLDRALEDRRVTVDEARQLEDCATNLGLSRADVIAIHEQYLRDLVRVALADGVITPHEQQDLEYVRSLLGISSDDFAQMVGDESQSGGAWAEGEQREGCAYEGKSVCFTGTLQCRVSGDRATRESAEEHARRVGMVVKRTVTKSLDYLVTADPDSLSGKAQKAQRYGVRVVAEMVFWRMVGVDPE